MLHFYKNDSIADFSNLKFRQTVTVGSGAVQKCTDLVEIENVATRKFIANIGFGTAENEPCKVRQTFGKHLAKFAANMHVLL